MRRSKQSTPGCSMTGSKLDSSSASWDMYCIYRWENEGGAIGRIDRTNLRMAPTSF